MAPWRDGEGPLTTAYRWYLATWAERLGWSEVGPIVRTSWGRVCRAVGHAVAGGLAPRDRSGPTAPGADEVAWAQGPTDATPVYDISGRTKRPSAGPWPRGGRTRARVRARKVGEKRPASGWASGAATWGSRPST